MKFVWDKNKNQTNAVKHGVTFEQAETVFYDSAARLIGDPDHSHSEDRFILLGMSSVSNLLVVVHLYREDNDVIRIISARKATKREQTNYKR